ncbi:MAG: ParA family protein [Fusobacteriaceae bacterium]|nr:ParA family protein [Fusobacteriaceae bacterium]
MKILAFSNQKGGVGKTTTVQNLGKGLSNLGKKVLLVDLDAQGNLTDSYGIDNQSLNKTVYHVLKGSESIKNVIMKSQGVDILPSNLELSGADLEFSSIPGREFLLKDALEELSEYDYILIDCPPNLSIMTLNALSAAHKVYIPLQTEYYSIKGMAQLLDSIKLIKKRINHKLELGGVICTMYDKRKNLNKEVKDIIDEYFEGRVLNTQIRENISLAEAPSKSISIFDYKPNSNGAEDYLNLAKEIIEREEQDGNY